MANPHSRGAAGKLLLLLGFSIFFYTGYQTMTYGESMRVSHHATGETSMFSWVLSGSGAPSTGILLVVAALITLAGGLVSQGPLKPIVISKAPPVTGEYPEFRDFISFNNRGRILAAAD